MPKVPPATPVDSRQWAALCDGAYRSDTRFAVFCGDAASRLSALPAGKIHTCLTSPPYWSARDYDDDRQIGLEQSVDDYVAAIVQVFRGVRRVLCDEGTVWLNLGDCYLHQTRPRGGDWQRNKQLALVPFRVAIALQQEGWIVRNVAVWNKPNAMPSSVTDRLTNAWEPVFLLAKQERYHFDLDQIRVPHKTSDEVERVRAEKGVANGKARSSPELRKWLNSPRHRATIDGLKEIRRRPNAPTPVELAAYLRAAAAAKGLSIQDVASMLGLPFERVRHYMRTDEIGSRLPPEETWTRLKDLLELGTEYDDAMAVEVGDNVFRNHPLGRNPGDVQSFAIKGDCAGHFATMPRALAVWALKATLPKGGICIDPFMGLGTTGLAAIDLGARFVGIDLKREYLDAFCQAAKSHERRHKLEFGQRPIKANGVELSEPGSGPKSRQLGAE